jgi:hypothetical protein
MAMKDYLAAVDREQKAWAALEGRLPGMAGSSPALWAEWVEATAQLNAEMARMTQRPAAPAQRGGLQRGPSRTA